ncbi:type II and III secretion system protein family protein [Novispirillum sp. DQ9]|uniref:type II and III secretion system protein family protein n=1 Tax=Novispirillum sp. DQ9 TaxID=3398612 RepID=UPI003C79E1E3
MIPCRIAPLGRFVRLGLPSLLAAALCATLTLAAAPAPSAAQQAAPPGPGLLVDTAARGTEMEVPVNKSQVLRVDQPFRDIMVGNPEVADVMPLSDRAIYVLGKQVGSTNLSIYGANRRLLAVVDLNVTHDAAGLRGRLNEIMPGEAIEVRGVNGGLVLSGAVSSARQLDRAMQIARRYAPDAVTNLLTVTGSQQVMVSVRVAEVRRSLARELGIKPTIIGGDIVVSALETLDPSRFLGALWNIEASDFTVDLLIDALEEKGALKVLAEPNLIALSGDTANFLAGGEFPVPVAQDADNGVATVTVEWKQFGVSLAFTPTVLDGDLINLRVAPEVSQIDTTNTVTLLGTTIPGLSTRRAETTVELRDGQSFAIAGLLQSDFSDTIRQVPGLGDVPVLGSLFRSSAFQRSETELVIIVTPRLVQPVPAGSLAAPTDTFVPPSEIDMFLLGRADSTPADAGIGGRGVVEVLGARSEGGISGAYGHILK